MPSQEQLEQKVRGRLGDPSEAELPSTQIENALEGALREFASFEPVRVEHTITLVAGQSEYPLPTGTVEVDEFVARDESEITFPGFTEFSPTSVHPDHYPFWRGIHSDYLFARGEVDPDLQVLDGDPPTLRIIPAPEHAGTLLLVLDRVPEVTTLPAHTAEAIIQWAVGDCLEYIGRKRSKPVTKIPTATGRLELDDGAKLREEGCELKAKVESKWGSGASTVVGG